MVKTATSPGAMVAIPTSQPLMLRSGVGQRGDAGQGERERGERSLSRARVRGPAAPAVHSTATRRPRAAPAPDHNTPRASVAWTPSHGQPPPSPTHTCPMPIRNWKGLPRLALASNCWPFVRRPS